MNKKKVLVGLSWPYANGRLHIGHVASSLPADALARFHRQIGNDVSFVTGSDCFGTPILVTAIAEGTTPEAVAEKYHQLLEKDFRALGFTFDNYSKTMCADHQKFVQKFHAEMYRGDFIYEKTAPQLYCESCKKYLPDRYVEGVCPHCKKEAKGDSCDHCGKMLEPEELISPRCKLCGHTPVSRDTTQLYLKLSALQEKLQSAFDARKEKWTPNAIGLTQRYINEGLHDRAITRSIEWGIPLPPMEDTKFAKYDWSDKRIYIWAENVLGYLSASTPEFIEEATYEHSDGCGCGECANRSDEKLHYYVHAKDNIPFHSLILPGLILAHGNGEPKYHLPDIIVSSEYITLEGQKISKSKGNLLTATELIDEFDTDMIRYYFLRTISSTKDSNFTFVDFVNVVNGELINNFGNLVNRTLSFAKNKLNSEVEFVAYDTHEREEFDELVTAGHIGKALTKVMDYVNTANAYFNSCVPWKTIDTDIELCKKNISQVIAMIWECTKMLEIYVPNSCEKVLDWLDTAQKTGKLPEIEILFQRLDMKTVQEKFSKYV